MTHATRFLFAVPVGLMLALSAPLTAAATGFHDGEARDPQVLMHTVDAQLASLGNRQSKRGALPIYTVGGADDGCSFTDLQTAIDNTPASAELRLANTGTYNSPLDLFGKETFHIIGGYSSCSSTSPTGRTVINSGGSRVLDIWSEFTTSPEQIKLANLNLTGADTISIGAGILLEGNYHLVLDNVRILSNKTSNHGGGLYVTPSSAFVEIVNFSQIAQNEAAGNGGGIWCGGEAEIVMDASVIAANQAENGGGVHLENGCQMWSFAGGPFQGIALNSATSRGGGVHVTADSALYLLGYAAGGWGNNTYPAALHLNNAGISGGGAYIDGANAGVLAIDGMIEGNQAEVTSGGVAAINGGTLIMHPATPSLCQQCSRLSGNQAGGAGGAVRLFFNGRATITRTWIRDNVTTLNESSPGVGGAIWGGGPETYLEGNIFTGNVGRNVVQFSAQGASNEHTLAWSTFADNQASRAVIRVVSSTDDTLNAALHSNIIWEQDGEPPVLSQAGDGTIVFDELSCLLAHETGSIPAGDLINVGNPFFVDAAGGDFRLQAGSAAIDACDNRVPPEHGDFIGTTRGIPYDANAGAYPFDLGAFEMLPDAIFFDRFE